MKTSSYPLFILSFHLLIYDTYSYRLRIQSFVCHLRMHTRSSLPFGLLLAAFATVTSGQSCNNSPNLCSKTYNEVTYLGAHDSAFIRDASTDFSTSGDQYYNTTVQLDAGVRLVTAQFQHPDSSSSELHACHTSCDLLDAGPLSSWLAEILRWIEANPDNVVTVLLVNTDHVSASEIAAQYSAAGFESSRLYVPKYTTAAQQAGNWETLNGMLGKVVTFIDNVDYDSSLPYILPQYNYIFENDYNNDSPTSYSCDIYNPSDRTTTQALSEGFMPLMNHFLYEVSTGTIVIQSPNASYVGTTNSPNSGVGTLGTAANTCRQYYGRAPSFILVDFFNVGPAIATVDRLNNVTSPVGRKVVSKANEAPDSFASNLVVPTGWTMLSSTLTVLFVWFLR